MKGLHRGGMSLIEILLSMMVVSIAIITTVSVMSRTGIQNETQKNQTQATKACQETLELLLALPYDQMINPSSFDNLPGQPPPVILRPNERFQGFFRVKPPLADNRWIGEFEIRDMTQDWVNEIAAASPGARSALKVDADDRWLAAQITVRLRLPNVNVVLTARREP